MSLTLPQRLALVKWLTDNIARVRKDDLLPEATAEMPPGSRMPIMFGGRHAGFASMPKPSTSASVTDEARLLAWTRANYPEKIRETVEVDLSDEDLIPFLEQHFPSAVKHGERVDQHWVSDICGALKDPGHYITSTGEKLTEVPGITVSESTPSPRVNLTPDAGAIIAAAWRGGDIPVAEFLALPAGGEDQ